MSEGRIKYKVVFLGDQFVGKTSIIEQYAYSTFEPNTTATVGIDFLAKNITVDDRQIRLLLWDTAGQERFHSLIPSYLRDAQCAVIVFDVTSKRSFQGVEKWYNDVRTIRGQEALIALVANKIDCERVISENEAKDYAKSRDILYFEVSAKTGHGIQQALETIVISMPSEQSFLITQSQLFKCRTDYTILKKTTSLVINEQKEYKKVLLILQYIQIKWMTCQNVLKYFSINFLAKFLDIQLNELLKSQIENPFIQALQVQRDRISQPIKIEQVLYRQGCYFYQIKSHLGESYRRYSDFEMLRQYILNQYPNFIQKPLPQKETIIQNISKYIIENKELIELRKKKFYIYLNDLQEKIKDDDIFLKFVNIQEEFKDILLKVDPNIVEQMKYVTRVFQYGLSYVQKNPIPEKLQMITNAIKQKMELIITCSQHLDNLQTTIKLKQKQAKILMPQLEHFQEIFNQKAEKIQSLYQRSDALLTIQGILWRLQETLEIYRDLQMKEEYLLAFDSYCLKQIQYTQEEFQKI